MLRVGPDGALSFPDREPYESSSGVQDAPVCVSHAEEHARRAHAGEVHGPDCPSQAPAAGSSMLPPCASCLVRYYVSLRSSPQLTVHDMLNAVSVAAPLLPLQLAKQRPSKQNTCSVPGTNPVQNAVGCILVELLDLVLFFGLLGLHRMWLCDFLVNKATFWAGSRGSAAAVILFFRFEERDLNV